MIIKECTLLIIGSLVLYQEILGKGSECHQISTLEEKNNSGDYIETKETIFVSSELTCYRAFKRFTSWMLQPSIRLDTI